MTGLGCSAIRIASGIAHHAQVCTEEEREEKEPFMKEPIKHFDAGRLGMQNKKKQCSKRKHHQIGVGRK